jgi:hypothetical protein
MKIKLLIGGLMLASVLLRAGTDAPTVKLIVAVSSLDGRPVPSANVGVGTARIYQTQRGSYPYETTGVTDEQGQFAATLGSPDGEVDAYARCKGFYENRSGLTRLYTSSEDLVRAQAQGHWEPLERTLKIVLRPIKNPVPMYAKKVVAVIPEANKPIGFDLEQGEWVAPYGAGKTADFEFFLENGEVKNPDYGVRLSLRMPGASNGIQNYELADPNAPYLFYEAPADGYQPVWELKLGRNGDSRPQLIAAADSDYSRHLSQRFIFRVRSVLDAQGHLTSACYGKIYGPRQLSPRPNGQWAIHFLYYLNPDKTRNLEFDPSHNLLGGQAKLPP